MKNHKDKIETRLIHAGEPQPHIEGEHHCIALLLTTPRDHMPVFVY